MMLQPHSTHLVTEGNVLKRCDDVCPTSSEMEGNDENPFSFKPQVTHLSKDHERFEDGDVQRHLYLQNLYISAADEEPSLRVSEFACHISGCTAIFKTLQEYEHHYNSLHRHVCCICRRSLPTARLLDIHIQEWHDSLFAVLALKEDMYQCLVEGCGLKFRTIKDRKDHLINIHKYPPDFRFDKLKKENRDKRRTQPTDTAMDVVTHVCESEVAFEVVCSNMSKQSEDPEPIEMNISEETPGHMETAESTAPCPTEPTKPRYSYRVPPNVCFGQGSVRGFRGRRGKRK
ncbi:zinc finger protein 511 [Eucyclogobius newberryi]|uniref:zinc finger protein 511 n=1 Tax=Eucyclogobius newberryi TaxID=166745 RepID=UPI003B5BAEDB